MESDNFLWPGPRNCGDRNVTLKMNECCLDIVADLNTASRFYTRSTACVNCNFILQKPVIEPNEVASFILNTEYPLDFYIENKKKILCNRTYSFGDFGCYFLNLSHGACSNIQIKEQPESSWTDFGVLLSIFTGVLLAYILYKCVLTARCLNPVPGQVTFHELEADLGNPDARDQNKPYIHVRTRRHSRIATIDIFRGITISLMIFVNYGGGGFTTFKHSPWNGITVADLVFPWFIWIMGMSIAMSLRSKLRTSVSRKKILCRIVERSLLLFALGLILNSGIKNNLLLKELDSFGSLRIPGVLQRIALTYFVVALTELTFMKPQRNEQFGPWNVCADIIDSAVQWIITFIIVAAHALITFLLPVPGCPTGYLGPGGLHEHSKFEKCVGGAAGYIDRLLLTNDHLYQHPTCKRIYHTDLPYDPEGVLGTFTSIFCAFLGVHAGRIILSFESTTSRIVRWLAWGGVLGVVAGLLCNFDKNDGIIPINKNLWSISYVCFTTSLAFVIFSILYILIDSRRLYNGFPFLYAGMNSLALYVGHEVFKKFLPWYWKPRTDTHIELVSMNVSATILWLGVAYLLYRRNVFIVL